MLTSIVRSAAPPNLVRKGAGWDLVLVKGLRARALFFLNRLTQRPERGSEVRAGRLRLFPGREMSAPVDLVEVDQVAIGVSGSCLQGSTNLLWNIVSRAS